MTRYIHSMIQDSDNRNAVARYAKINDMLFNAAPSVARSDMRTALRLLRGLRQIGAGRFDAVNIANGLRQTPLRDAIVKHPVEIALRGWTEAVFSQIARPCAP